MSNDKGPLVLIIDDDEFIRGSIRYYLEDHDYRVLEAENRRVGLEIFARAQPDLVLVGLRMPEVDGLELLASVRKSSPDTPIIVVSGVSVFSDVVQALRLGAWDYLLKPIADFSVLQHALDRLFERSRLIRENQLYQEHLEQEVKRRTQNLEWANTELSQINARLRQSEEKYRAIFENLQDIYYEVLLDGTIVEVSPSVELVSKYRREEILGVNARDLYVKPEQRQRLLERLSRQGRVSDYEICFRDKDGSVIPFSITARLQAETAAGQSRVYGTLRNISQRKQAEEEMRLAATAFETHEGIIITDKDSRILRVNRAFKQITGYTSDEVIGQTPHILHSERQDTEFYREMWGALGKTGRWQGEVWNRRKNGSIFPEWLSITAVKNKQGVVTHYVGAFVDLSEAKHQQQTIARTEIEEKILGTLLRLSLQPLVMEDFLQKALDTLLGYASWLGSLPKGGIFVTESDAQNPVLKLIASHHMEPEQRILCEQVPFGNCLCGRAAISRAVEFSNGVDSSPGICSKGMAPHGHYNVPILAGEDVLGVIVLYLQQGHVREDHEEVFLRRVADVLSMGISRRHADARIEYLAYYDALTELPNRRLLLDRLQQNLVIAERRSVYGAVLFLDLDHFKTLNDALGHPVGDLLLQQVAQRLLQQIRATDTVARLGGDEFVVLLPNLSENLKKVGFEAWTVAEKLRRAISEPYDLKGHEYHLTPSIGIVLFPVEGDNTDEILKHADAAMYRAKADGRDTVRFYLPSMQAEADVRLALEKDLRRAVARKELCLYFQPQVDLETQEVIGAEALLRWRHPERGMIYPDDFIQVAEQTGLILSIGDWVLQEACNQLRAWMDKGFGHSLRYLAVNVSPWQFQQPDFTQRIERILGQAGAEPAWLGLELTEGVMIENMADTVDKMQALQLLGVHLSIDDFGTGYSSLTYLKRLPLDVLKIDQSFVRNIATDPNNAAIVDTIIAMASHLGLQVIAEGVETAAELDLLQAKGCRIYQGHYFSQPLPAEAFADFVRNGVSS